MATRPVNGYDVCIVVQRSVMVERSGIGLPLVALRRLDMQGSIGAVPWIWPAGPPMASGRGSTDGRLGIVETKTVLRGKTLWTG